MPSGFVFPSRAVGDAFVAAWHEALNTSQPGVSADRSIADVLKHFPNGATLTLHVSRAGNALGVTHGETAQAAVVSLDGARALLLYPPTPLGSLFSPSRLVNHLNIGAKWKQALRLRVRLPEGTAPPSKRCKHVRAHEASASASGPAAPAGEDGAVERPDPTDAADAAAMAPSPSSAPSPSVWLRNWDQLDAAASKGEAFLGEVMWEEGGGGTGAIDELDVAAPSDVEWAQREDAVEVAGPGGAEGDLLAAVVGLPAWLTPRSKVDATQGGLSGQKRPRDDTVETTTPNGSVVLGPSVPAVSPLPAAATPAMAAPLAMAPAAALVVAAPAAASPSSLSLPEPVTAPHGGVHRTTLWRRKQKELAGKTPR